MWFRFWQFLVVVFHSSAVKPTSDKCSTTGRINSARYFAGDRLRTSFLPNSRKHSFGPLLTCGIVGVVTVWQLSYFPKIRTDFENLCGKRFCLHTPAPMTFSARQRPLQNGVSMPCRLTFDLEPSQVAYSQKPWTRWCLQAHKPFNSQNSKPQKTTIYIYIYICIYIYVY